jgi:hypothetical protein
MHMRVTHILALVGLIVSLASGALPANATGRAAAASAQPAAAPQTQANTYTPDCPPNSGSSPFGGQLTLGAEKEALVGYVGSNRPASNYVLRHDRYDLNGAKQLYSTGSWSAAGQSPVQNVDGSASVAVDLTGAGSDNLVQAFSDASNGTLWVAQSSASGTSFSQLNRTARTSLAIAAGNPTRRDDSARRLAIASVIDPAHFNLDPIQFSGPGAVSVVLPLARADGSIFDERSDGVFPNWSTVQNNRAFATNINVAIGDLDGDGYKDEIVLALADRTGAIQVIVLKYDPSMTVAVGSGDTTLSYKLAEIASTTLNIGTPTNMRLAVGDVDARYQNAVDKSYADEIVIAADNADQENQTNVLHLRTLHLNVVKDPNGVVVSRQIVDQGSWDTTEYHRDLALAIGDTDGDGRDEPVLADDSYGNNNPLVIRTFDAERQQLSVHNRLDTFDNFRSQAYNLSVAAGDMDRDGIAEIVAAFGDSGNQLQTIQVSDQLATTGDDPLHPGLQLRSAVRRDLGAGNFAFGLSATLGDWDGDSLRAVFAPAYGEGINCYHLSEPNLAAVVFSPPYWERLQGERVRAASIGTSTGNGTAAESSLETSTSHSVSAYFGAEVGGELGPVEAEASIKATAGYEYQKRLSSSGGVETEQTTAQAFETREGPFVVLQRANYNCYTYQLRQGQQTLTGAANICEDQDHTIVSSNLSNWDADYGPLAQPGTQQWTPIGRDWASLSLFRRAEQSSTEGAASAERSVDGDSGDRSAAHSAYQQTNAMLSQGTVSKTQVEAQPWWQVDLGNTQELTAVRIWHRYNYDPDCGQQTCAAQMGGFYVFVSDTDFHTLPNDPNALKDDPRVHAYYFETAAPHVTNIQLGELVGGQPEPIRARYIRVQLAGTGALALAEVQAFGELHIDPDRYPVWVGDSDAAYARDPSTGKWTLTPGSDGVFEVGIHAPNGSIRTVEMRGNLRWTTNFNQNGTLLNNMQGRVVISKGDTEFAWSLANEKRQTASQGQSIENVVKVGAELEAKAGVGVKVQAGVGYEFSAGVLRDTTNSISWSEGLELGGGIQGFPNNLDTNAVRACEYSFQPFYYEAIEEATSGFQHRFMMVDSVVPDYPLNRSTDLSFCQASISETPQFESNVAEGAPGSLFVLTASGFPANAPVTIGLKGPREADYRTLAHLTMQPSGQLVFVLATRATDALGDYSVQISTDARQASAPTTLSTHFTLRADAPQQTDRPASATTISTDGQVAGPHTVYLPLVAR